MACVGTAFRVTCLLVLLPLLDQCHKSSEKLTVVQPAKKLPHSMQSDFHQRIQTDPPQLAGHCVSLHIVLLPLWSSQPSASDFHSSSLRVFFLSYSCYMIGPRCPALFYQFHISLSCSDALTTPHSPLTAHRSPLTAHRSPLTAPRSPLTTSRSPLTTYHSPLTSIYSLHSWPVLTFMSL